MEYIGSAAFAEKWNVSQGTVSRWCREGKIKGAEQDRTGSPWRIPANAVPPNKRGE